MHKLSKRTLKEMDSTDKPFPLSAGGVLREGSVRFWNNDDITDISLFLMGIWNMLKVQNHVFIRCHRRITH